MGTLSVKKVRLMNVSICAGDAVETGKEKENDSALLNAVAIGGAGHEDESAAANKVSSVSSLGNEHAGEIDGDSVGEADPDWLPIFESPAVAGPAKLTPGLPTPKRRRTEGETKESGAHSCKVSCIRVR